MKIFHVKICKRKSCWTWDTTAW